MKINIGILLFVVAVIIMGGIWFSSKKSNDSTISVNQTAGNVSVVDGKQIITINVRGGYSPRITTAKADVPTVINFKTQNAFDCSSAVTIPSLGYKNNLPATGETLFEIPVQKAGSAVSGTCSMGMYNFTINFN